MKFIKTALIAACIATSPVTAHAHKVGESNFAWVSDLAQEGFEPFAVSGTGKASFGMMKGTDMYLCFIADRKEHQAIRQKKLLANMKKDNSSRAVPNIPVACVLAQ